MFIIGKLKLATSVYARLGFRFLVISYNEPLKYLCLIRCFLNCVLFKRKDSLRSRMLVDTQLF